MNTREKIRKMRFDDKLTVQKIADDLGMCKQNVSRILIRFYGGAGEKIYKHPPVIIICKWCGLAKKSLIKNGLAARFCSRKCIFLYKGNNRKCPKCGIKVPPIWEKRTKLCRECSTIKSKKYRRTKKGKAISSQSAKRYINKFREKQNARVLLNYYIKKGEIARPKTCEKCKLVLKLDGHHEDYKKPLEVKWLCRLCHSNIHTEKRKLAAYKKIEK